MSGTSTGARGQTPITYVSRKRWRDVLTVALLVALASVAVPGCGDDEIVNPHFRYDHRSDWESHNPTEYVIDQLRICFCVYQLDTVRLTVVNDSIISAIEKSTGQALTPAQLAGYLTVNQLFDWTEELDRMTVATSTIVYRSDYGYPSYIYVDYDAGIADDEISVATELIEINGAAAR